MAATTLVLLASARPAGHAAALVAQVLAATPYYLLDVREVVLHPYSYSGRYPPADGFARVAQQLVQHDTLVLATPRCTGMP